MIWLSLSFACAPVDPDAARMAFLEEAFVRADAPWLSRDPALLGAKYARMAADPYDYLRGGLPIYWADQARLVGQRRTTAFLNEPDAGQVLLFGDAHPENLGTGAIGDLTNPSAVTLTADVVDLDAAAHGPWLLDVRRSALAMWTFSNVDACDEGCREGLIGALARAYVDELGQLSAGEDPSPPSGSVVGAMVADAAADGPDRKEHQKCVVDGALALGLVDGVGLAALDREDQARVDRLLVAFAPRRPGLRALDVARRVGQGVASMPAIRFLVLYDFGGDDESDDDLLQIREVVDTFTPAGLTPGLVGVFPGGGARVELATRWLQVAPEGDPNLAGLQDGAQSFKVRSASGWGADIEHLDVHDDLAAGLLGPGDLADLAAFLGRRLADGHAAAPMADGGDALPVLLREVGGQQDALVDELISAARADHASLMSDYALFQDLIAVRGERLGAERLVEDVR